MGIDSNAVRLTRITGLAKLLTKLQRGRLNHVVNVTRDQKHTEAALKVVVGFGKLNAAELQKCLDHQIPLSLVELVAWLLPLAFPKPGSSSNQTATGISKQALSLWKWATSLLHRLCYDLAVSSSYQQRDRDLLTQLQPTSDDGHPGKPYTLDHGRVLPRSH